MPCAAAHRAEHCNAKLFLHHAAAALPHVDISKPQNVIGTNTVACMQSGVFWGYVGLVREICDRIKAESGVPMKVISTGGLAPLFQQTADQGHHR